MKLINKYTKINKNLTALQKKVLFVNVNTKEFDYKTFYDLNQYIGGVAVGLKLYKDFEDINKNKDSDPVIFSIGPLNGLFPFASKTSIVYLNEGNLEDVYLGGSLSNRIKFLGVDAIVIFGKSAEPVQLDIQEDKVIFKEEEDYVEELGLPSKKCTILISKNQLLLDNYFTTKENGLCRILNKNNIKSIVITGSKNIVIKDFEKYKNIYNSILNKKNEMSVKSYTNPSCSGCPMGCRKSKEGEIGGNILIHSLVACEFSENIYSDIGIVFSCLNVLGYNYTHEDIENLPKLVEEILKWNILLLITKWTITSWW